MGKAKQQVEMGDHSSALELLLILETETKNQLNQAGGANSAANNNSVMYKLSKLVGWEALLMQITQVRQTLYVCVLFLYDIFIIVMFQMLADWPLHKNNMELLMKKSTLCVLALQSGNGIIPRMEVNYNMKY